MGNVWIQESSSIYSAEFRFRVIYMTVGPSSGGFRFLQGPAATLHFVAPRLFPHLRLARKKKEFLDNIAHLSGEDAALSDDDLRDELREASDTVSKALCFESS